jgi:uncharacterized OB-fold protein
MTDLPIPAPTALSQPFWQAAREGRLALQRCDNCGAYRWTPQILCTRCQSEGYAWTEVSGRGEIYSFTVVHRAPTPGFSIPYVVAVVALAEGPLMLTNIVGCEPDEIYIDMPVVVAFEPLSESIHAYRFRPAVSC